MIVHENGRTLDLLGDPHLGRQFINGVPLHRRGEREAMVWRDFRRSLFNTSADLHVNMGDLFDKWMVSLDVIMGAASAYLEAASQNPTTTYVILKGNHDWIRDLERSSAFDVFAAIVQHAKNIRVVTEPTIIDGLLFYPYHPTADATEEVSAYADQVPAAFGHWDTDFGDHNLVPTKAGIPKLYTGHIHKPTSFKRDGVDVIVVGSMQPYAHGEEVNDDLYVTLDKPEGDLRMKCVRLTSAPEQPVDCLHLTIQQQKGSNDPDDSGNVSLGDFDMDALFRGAFKEAEVPDHITDQLLAQYHSKRVATHA